MDSLFLSPLSLLLSPPFRLALHQIGIFVSFGTEKSKLAGISSVAADRYAVATPKGCDSSNWCRDGSFVSSKQRRRS